MQVQIYLEQKDIYFQEKFIGLECSFWMKEELNLMLNGVVIIESLK